MFRFKLQQLCDIYETMEPLKDTSMYFNIVDAMSGYTHSYTHLAGCADLVCVLALAPCSALCRTHKSAV